MDDAKRECILVAAVKAFSRLGFRKTSIDEVAQEAGVGKGTIYLAVSSKDELFLQAVEREVRAFLAAGRRVVSATDEALELLATLLVTEVREASRRPLVHGLFVGQTLATVPRAERAVADLQNKLRENLAAALEGARGTGLLREDLDIRHVARILQDLEVAALVRLERRHDAEARLANLDFRPDIDTFIRGLRRPLALVRAAS